MSLKSSSRVLKVVNKSSLLDELVLSVDAHVFHLGLSVDQVLHLDLLSSVNPLGSHLSDLVLGVDVVEDGELRSDHVGEVSGLNNSDVPSDKELVVEEHTSKPFVVRPAAHSREGSDGSNVEEHEEESSSGTREGLVVRRNLLRADSLHKVSQVVVVRVHKRVVGGVVRVDVSLSHGVDFVLVVALSIESFVLGLGTIHKLMLLKLNRVLTLVQSKLGWYLHVSRSTSGSGSSLFGRVSFLESALDRGT